MQSVLHSPHVAPRNAFDWRVLLIYYLALIPVAGLAAVAWCGIPALIALALTANPFVAGLVALGMDIVWIVYFSRMIFKSITTDGTGLTLHRVMGGDVFIAWDDIETIEPIDRETLVREAWLKFPPPLQSHSVGASGHWRIRWKNGGVAYFPPQDVEAWEREMRKGSQRMAGPWYTARATAPRASELRNGRGWS